MTAWRWRPLWGAALILAASIRAVSGVSGELPGVMIRSPNPQGVPVHATRGPTAVVSRLPNGSVVQVVQRMPQWIRVRSAGAIQGWVSMRYVVQGPEGDASSEISAVWSSAQSCERAFATGERLSRRDHSARIATWNLEWFPYGEKPPSLHRTNLEWLSCLLAWMQVDVVAVQEILSDDVGKQGMEQLLSSLQVKTGGSWKYLGDACPDALSRSHQAAASFSRQHVGVLYNASRVEVVRHADIAALNPSGSPCGMYLRPGFAAYLRFRTGLDFHLISIHLDSGSSGRDFGNRARSIARLPESLSELSRLEQDADVVVAGDFNNMGCRLGRDPYSQAKGCDRAVRPRTEFRQWQRSADLAGLEFRPAATARTNERCETRLDRFAVTHDARELLNGGRALTHGPCACGLVPRRLLFADEISDHCPVTLDLTAEDLDP